MRKILVYIDHHYPWGIIGVLIGLVLGVPPLWAMLAQKTSVTGYIMNKTDVVQETNRISDLKVVFKGRDLFKHGENLRLFRIAIENTGSTTIRETDYDSKSQLRLQIQEGSIIGYGFIETNTTYSEEELVFKPTNDSLALPKIILEPNKRYVFDLLVLHARSTDPRIALRGKVADVDTMDLTNALGDVWYDRLTFFEKLLNGPIWVHVIRLVLYTMVAVLSLLGYSSLRDWIHQSAESFPSSERGRRIKQIIEKRNYKWLDDFYISLGYTDHGIAFLQRLRAILLAPQQMTVFLSALEKQREAAAKIREFNTIVESISGRGSTSNSETSLNSLEEYYAPVRIDTIRSLMDKKVIVNRGKSIFGVDPVYLAQLDELISTLADPL